MNTNQEISQGYVAIPLREYNNLKAFEQAMIEEHTFEIYDADWLHSPVQIFTKEEVVKVIAERNSALREELIRARKANEKLLSQNGVKQLSLWQFIKLKLGK